MFELSPAALADQDQRRKNYAVLAEIAHDFFVAFSAVGFAPDQALELTMQGMEFGYHRDLG